MVSNVMFLCASFKVLALPQSILPKLLLFLYMSSRFYSFCQAHGWALNRWLRCTHSPLQVWLLI